MVELEGQSVQLSKGLVCPRVEVSLPKGQCQGQLIQGSVSAGAPGALLFLVCFLMRCKHIRNSLHQNNSVAPESEKKFFFGREAKSEAAFISRPAVLFVDAVVVVVGQTNPPHPRYTASQP